MRGDLGLQKQTLNLYIGSFNIYKKKKKLKNPKENTTKKKGEKEKPQRDGERREDERKWVASNPSNKN